MAEIGRATQFLRVEVREDPQYGRRVHEQSGKRVLCHCRQNEKCHADSLRDLFRDRHPHAFGPSSSDRPLLSSELNILAKGREDRENSEEPGLEEAETNAPQGWPGTGRLVVIRSGMSKGDCAKVKVSARHAPQHQQIEGILHRCGPASPDFS